MHLHGLSQIDYHEPCSFDHLLHGESVMDKVRPIVWIVIGFVLGCLFVWAVQNFLM